MSGDPNLVAGVCSGLPLGIQDLWIGYNVLDSPMRDE